MKFFSKIYSWLNDKKAERLVRKERLRAFDSLPASQRTEELRKFVENPEAVMDRVSKLLEKIENENAKALKDEFGIDDSNDKKTTHPDVSAIQKGKRGRKGVGPD
jgi:hypothetical protein